MFNKIFLCVLSLCVSWQIVAQDRFVVHFGDKANSTFSIDRPLEFLSQKSLDRRTAQGINLSEIDLPVSSAYLDSLKELDIHVFFKSKWFNAVLVQITTEQKNVLLTKDYISDVEFVGPGNQLTIGNTNIDFSGSEIVTTNTSNLSTAKQNEMIGVDRMHEAGYKGEGMLIGVFDGGFSLANRLSAFNHLRAEDRIIYTYDFTHNEIDPYGYATHGMEVLSTMAGIHGTDYIGTAPEAEYVLCVTEDVSNECRIEEYNWLFAAELADSIGVDLIVSSLGYYDFDACSPSYDASTDLDGNTTVVSKTATLASERGILVVVSAGNSGRVNEPGGKISAPADAENIIAVGSVTSTGIRSDFSSRGPTSDGRIKPDLMAQGSSSVVVKGSGNIGSNSGTSFSAPIMTGLAAGLWQANPSLSNIEIIEKLRDSASKSLNPDNSFGYGIPDFLKANGEDILSSNFNIAKTPFRAYPNPIGDSGFYIESDQEFEIKQFNLKLYSAIGKRINFKSIQDSENRVHIILEAARGSYVAIMSGQNESYTFKLIK